MHRPDDAEVDAAVCDLSFLERFGDDADRLAPDVERRVGQRAHQSDARPAVDDADTSVREEFSELAGGRNVGRVAPDVRTTVDTEPVHALPTVR